MMTQDKTDKAFSNLEQLAFMGMWSRIEHVYIWSTLGISEQLENSHASPEHDRFQHLRAVYETICDNTASGLDDSGKELIESYIAKYRIPENDVHKAIREIPARKNPALQESAASTQYDPNDTEANL